MEDEFKKALGKASRQLLGKETDALIVAHRDGKCGVAIHGDAENIAQAMFTCMHDQNSDTDEALYRIFKLNLVNILSNPSKYKLDVMNIVMNFLERESNEQI